MSPLLRVAPTASESGSRYGSRKPLPVVALPQRLKPQLRRPSTFYSSIIQPQMRESMCGLSMTNDGVRATASLT